MIFEVLVNRKKVNKIFTNFIFRVSYMPVSVSSGSPCFRFCAID